MIKRTVVCGICTEQYTEEKEGDGFPGWGQISGIILNGDTNPYLCPKHLKNVANFADELVGVEHGMD